MHCCLRSADSSAFVGKSLLVDPATFAGLMIEAIGVVYLFDTYIEAHKKARIRRLEEIECID